MAANEAVGALLDELVALTCKHDSPPRSPPRTPPRIPNSFDANGSPVVRSSETRRVPAAPRRSTCEPTEEPTEEPTGFAQLPRCVLILLAKDYLTASQRAALAASDKYAREELVTNGDLAPSVWRVTHLSQADAVRMLSTVPPRAYAPLRWTNELVLLDSETRGFSRKTLGRYWQGLSLFVANAPALSVVRIRKSWRLSPLLFAAVKRRPAMRIEIAGPLTPEKLDDLAEEGYDLASEGRLMCSKLEVGTGPQASEILDYNSTWLGLWNHPALVELDLSHHAMGALPEALANLTTLRVLRADSMRQLRDTTVLARGPPALRVLSLNDNDRMAKLPARLACASSLVRLGLDGTRLNESFSNGIGAWDFVRDMSKLRLLHVYYVDYDKMIYENSVIAAHPCFIPSVLEFSYKSLTNNLIEHILDALPTMSPRQLKALEPALTSLEGYVQTADDDYIASTGRASVEDLRDFADEFRAAVGGDAPEESASAAREDGLPSWASGANELPMGGLRGPEGPDTPILNFTAPVYAPSRGSISSSECPNAYVVNVYHAISCMPAYSGKSFEELRLEAYQATAMSGEGLRAANAAFAALAAERDRLVFRAPSPVAALRVTPDKPFVFGATAAEPRVVTPETHSDKPFAFGANASGQEEPFVFGAKLDK